MDLNWVALIVAAVFSAGTAAIITAVYTGRNSARRIGVEADGIAAKTPAEVDSIAIQGAEATVLMMQGVNQALLRENERLAHKNEQLEALIAKLDKQLESYRERVEAAETALRAANQQYDELRQELDNLRS
jgi:predicted RNase H-like nuclease (RuvC/YqgF family)